MRAFETDARRQEIGYRIRRDFDLVKINGYTFSSFKTPDNLPKDLEITAYQGSESLFLVQTKAPSSAEWHRQMRSLGEVLAYYPQNTFLVRANTEAMADYRALSFVQHVSLFQPAYKIPASLRDRLDDTPVTI